MTKTYKIIVRFGQAPETWSKECYITAESEDDAIDTAWQLNPGATTISGPSGVATPVRRIMNLISWRKR